MCVCACVCAVFCVFQFDHGCLLQLTLSAGWVRVFAVHRRSLVAQAERKKKHEKDPEMYPFKKGNLITLRDGQTSTNVANACTYGTAAAAGGGGWIAASSPAMRGWKC